MKKLHLIHAKSLTDVPSKNHSKLLPILEKETLEWAQKFKADAYQATIEIQKEFIKNPNSANAKYFRYLRRLLELRLEHLEKEAGEGEKSQLQLNKELVDFLQIESLNRLDYLSCTQISMMEFCPRKFYYRYCLGIKMPKTAALHFGTAVDEALNFFFEEKAKGIKAPNSAVHAQFYENFEKEKDTVIWGTANPVSLSKVGPAVIDAYIKDFDKMTNPKEIQAEAIVQFEGGYLKGYLDILEEDAIVDTKTAAKPWETTGRYAKHLNELQPRAYSLWYLEEFGKMPKEFRYQIVTKDIDDKGDPKPQTQLIKFELKKFELEAFRTRIQKTWNSIQEGLLKGKAGFPAQADPKSRGDEPGYGFGKQNPGVLCCKQYCEYYDFCKKDFGKAVPLAWVSKTKDVPGHHQYEDEKDKSNEKATSKTPNS